MTVDASPSAASEPAPVVRPSQAAAGADSGAALAELRPVFLVTVTLDGDDDARSQTVNAWAALDHALTQMSDDGLIRDYLLELQT